MNISEGHFYESRDGEGYVYISERDGDLISYVGCSEPTKKALTAADAYIGETSKQDLEEMIVYPFCQCKGYTAWTDIPMDIHEYEDLSVRIEQLLEAAHDYKYQMQGHLEEVEEFCNIIKGILDRGDADEYEDEENEA